MATTDTPSSTRTTPTPPPGRSRAVLLVEDNPINQRVALGLLRKRGHRVVVANNGREALTALEVHGPFDVALMDIQMPEMDGLETTACIRQREVATGTYLVIIAMTAHAMRGDRERCLAAGMDAYLSKPFDPQVMFDAVESAGSAQATRQADDRGSSPLDIEAMRRRMGDDEDLVAEIIRLFLEDYPARVTAIDAAIADGDAERLRRTAHALKGGASTLAAHAVAAVADRLELLAVAGDFVAARRELPSLTDEGERLQAALQQLNARG